MKKYLEFKIMQKTVIMIISVLVVFFCIGGYVVWCTYHPDIQIQISESTAGENLNIEAPHIAFADRLGIKMADSIQLHISDMAMQHEFLCQYVRENYKSSDIKLGITVQNNQTILSYKGTVVSLDDEHLAFNREIVCDYVLNATINHKE